MADSSIEVVQNNINLDFGISRECSICNLPIFSTPYYRYNDSDIKHIRCANPPDELKDSDVHPGKPLTLWKKGLAAELMTCKICGRKCGTPLYFCYPSKQCKCCAAYHVSCTRTNKIIHRSHEHKLTALHPGSASFICGACGTRHDDDDDDDDDQDQRLAVAYQCHACGFWIHSNCASLPNIILLLKHEDSNSKHHHEHPLVLNYHLSSQESDDHERKCAICEGLIESVGDYSCTGCPNYRVHIKCAVLSPQSFKPMLFEEVRLPNLLRLPIPNEHTSVIHCIADSTISTSIAGSTSMGSRDHQLLQLHEHPLIFHGDDDDDDDDDELRVCNACVQFIVSPPFYRCSTCPDFILHGCCADLPLTLTDHPAHKQHSLSLLTKRAGGKYVMSIEDEIRCCYFPTNGFTYSCKDCKFHMDVLCALMPASITHDAHSETHILYSGFSQYSWRPAFPCCDRLSMGLYYECGTCRNFVLHSRCALLPKTISHRYDEHPLKLVTKTTTPKRSESSSTSTDDHDAAVYSSNQQQKLVLLCEICECVIDNRYWYYSCDECDQSFHIDCIPGLDPLNKIKLGGNIRVKRHNCPLTLIRGLTLYGSHCGYCGKTFKDYDHFNYPWRYDLVKGGLAFECSNCELRIHFNCAYEDMYSE